MQPYVIFQHLAHQAVDTAAYVCQEHEDIGAIVV
jgi:hypothetical protein